MINRIVRLSFQIQNKEEFVQVFNRHAEFMTDLFSACKSLKLMKDIHHDGVFFTYSVWESEKALQEYRDSDYFREIWGTVKPWFNEKAQAWSLVEYN